MSDRGFVKLSVVIAAVLGVGFVASAYLNFAQHQQAQGEQTLLQGQITDLTYQVKQDQLATSPSPTPSPSPAAAAASPTPVGSPTPTPSASPASTATVKIQGNIHSAASPSSTILLSYTHIPIGASVSLGTIVSNGYQQITYSGITGYIESSDLQF